MKLGLRKKSKLKITSLIITTIATNCYKYTIQVKSRELKNNKKKNIPSQTECL